MEVSVITTLFDESIFQLDRAISSILQQQTSFDFEVLVIVDNPGRADLTTVFEMYKNFDNVHILVNKTNLGLAMSLNTGIENSIGRFIARLDSDDWMYQGRLQRQHDDLVANSGTGLSFGESVQVDSETGLEKHVALPRPRHSGASLKSTLYKYNFIPHSSVMFSKADAQRVGMYRQIEPAEDYDFWLRMVDKGIDLLPIFDTIVYREIRRNSISNSDIYGQMIAARYVQWLHEQRTVDQSDEFSRYDMSHFMADNGYDSPAHHRFNAAFKAWNQLKLNKLNLRNWVFVFSSREYTFMIARNYLLRAVRFIGGRLKNE